MSALLWLIVGSLAFVTILLFAVMDRAKREDRASRHIHHSIRPFDRITITKPGD
jgi:hypothetical protein